MKHILSTHVIVNHRLTVSTLDKILYAGIPAVEIFCARQHFDYRDQAQIRELGHWFREVELKLHSLHAPMHSDDVWGRSGPNAMISITELEKRKRMAGLEELKRALEIAETVPFRYFIMHLGTPGEEYDDRRIDAAFGSLEELKLFARQRGVELLLENIPNQLSSAERLLLFNTQTHLDLNFCFDTGHAHLMEGIDNAFPLMAGRIRSTHVHDNDGTRDGHLCPTLDPEGTIEWSKTMKLLASRPDQYPLLLELKNTPDSHHPVDAALVAFENLEKLA